VLGPSIDDDDGDGDYQGAIEVRPDD